VLRMHCVFNNCGIVVTMGSFRDELILLHTTWTRDFAWEVESCGVTGIHFHSFVLSSHHCSNHWLAICPCSRLPYLAKFVIEMLLVTRDRLCGLVVRVPGYRSRGPGFDSRRYQIFWEVIGLERGPLNLVRIIEELLEWKSSGSGLENRD
jgi:hypothetical protein